MKSKIVKDLAHGFIEIDQYVANIIDHRSFQRLKNISQLTAHHLFPSANHTRFEHSLGVMHLSIKFMQALKKYFKEDDYKFDYIHLKYASLLHDVGHAPMSHVGEQFYNRDEIKEKLKESMHYKNDNSFSNAANHELMSCYVIVCKFKKFLEEIFEANSIKLDLDYIFRIITGTRYNEKNLWNRNLVIELLNSKSIDVDKIDYLIRDNIMVGNVAPSFNLERLLYSITIDDMKKLAFTPVGISSLVSIIDCRDFLYLWLYNHHIVVYTDFLYKTAIRHLSNTENQKSDYTISSENYFSCNAIAESCITDDDIRVLLNKEYTNTKSLYSKKVLSQLLERKFLKPLWKTIFDFNTFMYDSFDDRQRKEILKQIVKEENIKKIVSELIKKSNIMHGELFIIARSNKFYAMSESEFFININNARDFELKQIMPERRFDEKYSNVAFYVFTLADKTKIIKEELIQALINLIK